MNREQTSLENTEMKEEQGRQSSSNIFEDTTTTMRAGEKSVYDEASNQSFEFSRGRQRSDDDDSKDYKKQGQTKQYQQVGTKTIQEVPRFVPVPEIREIVKQVPKLEVEYVEKVVEVPQIQYVDKFEEKEEIQTVIKNMPKVEVVDVPIEKVKYVSVKTEKLVEKVVAVVSSTDKQFISVPVVKDVPFVVPQFKDTEVPLIISQTVVPEIQETEEEIEVEVSRYVPELVPVDIYVPRPVSVPVQKTDTVNQDRKAAMGIPADVMQKLMVEMNPHLQELEKFNTYQNKIFQETIDTSNRKASEVGLPTLPPLSAPLFTCDQQKVFMEKYGDPKEILKREQNAFRKAQEAAQQMSNTYMTNENSQNNFPNANSETFEKRDEIDNYNNFSPNDNQQKMAA